MKKIFFIATVIMLGGCVQSLHSFFKQKNLIFNDELLGRWTEDDTDSKIWIFEKADPDKFPEVKKGQATDGHKLIENYKENKMAYILRFEGKENILADYKAHLFKLGKYFYIDFYPNEDDIDDDFLGMHLVPTHSLARVEFSGKGPALSWINFNRIDKLLQQNKIRISHEKIEDGWILTAATDELQKFLIKYEDDKSLFEDQLKLNRQG